MTGNAKTVNIKYEREVTAQWFVQFQSHSTLHVEEKSFPMIGTIPKSVKIFTQGKQVITKLLVQTKSVNITCGREVIAQ